MVFVYMYFLALLPTDSRSNFTLQPPFLCLSTTVNHKDQWKTWQKLHYSLVDS